MPFLSTLQVSKPSSCLALALTSWPLYQYRYIRSMRRHRLIATLLVRSHGRFVYTRLLDWLQPLCTFLRSGKSSCFCLKHSTVKPHLHACLDLRIYAKAAVNSQLDPSTVISCCATVVCPLEDSGSSLAARSVFRWHIYSI